MFFYLNFTSPHLVLKCHVLIYSENVNYNGVTLSVQYSVHLRDKRSSQGLYQQVTMVLSARTGFFLPHWGAGGSGEVGNPGENEGPVTTQSRSVNKNASFPWPRFPFLLQPLALPIPPSPRTLSCLRHVCQTCHVHHCECES